MLQCFQGISLQGNKNNTFLSRLGGSFSKTSNTKIWVKFILGATWGQQAGKLHHLGGKWSRTELTLGNGFCRKFGIFSIALTNTLDFQEKKQKHIVSPVPKDSLCPVHELCGYLRIWAQSFLVKSLVTFAVSTVPPAPMDFYSAINCTELSVSWIVWIEMNGWILKDGGVY